MGQIPKGGGVEKNRRKFPISIWELWKPRGGGSRFFKNVWIRIRLKYNPRNKTKFGLFQCKYTLLKKNMTFYIIKRGRISLCFALSIQIWLFRWISEGVGRHQYVLNFKHVWICSERGGWYFSKMSEIQKCLNYPRGGVKPNWEFLPNFPVFF